MRRPWRPPSTPPGRSGRRVTAAYERLLAQVEAIADELRRRVGQTFTLAQLADAYAAADDWSRDVVAERASSPGWPRTVSVAEAAAFHAYQRGATDYEP
jgi:hypothetical protein